MTRTGEFILDIVDIPAAAPQEAATLPRRRHPQLHVVFLSRRHVLKQSLNAHQPETPIQPQ